MQALLRRLLPPVVFALFVASNFLFIFFSPEKITTIFLQTYAFSSLIFSFFGTSIYVTMRSKIFDLFLASILIILTIIYLLYTHTDFGHIILYVAAAASMIFAEYSIAQTRNNIALQMQRIGTALSALVLIYNFEAALLTRTIWLTAWMIYSVLIKNYDSRKINFLDINIHMIMYSTITCLLYFGTLSLTPLLFNEHAKEAYILFSLFGNLILKYQDYFIKKFLIEGHRTHSISNNRIAFILFASCLLALMLGSNLWLPLMALSGLILAGGVLHHARWT